MHRRRCDENVSPIERIDECDPSSGRSVDDDHSVPRSSVVALTSVENSLQVVTCHVPETKSTRGNRRFRQPTAMSRPQDDRNQEATVYLVGISYKGVHLV